VTWEKVGVRVVSKPVAHGSGCYLRVPKAVREAYDLFNAEAVEIEIVRVQRKAVSPAGGE